MVSTLNQRGTFPTYFQKEIKTFCPVIIYYHAGSGHPYSQILGSNDLLFAITFLSTHTYYKHAYIWGGKKKVNLNQPFFKVLGIFTSTYNLNQVYQSKSLFVKKLLRLSYIFARIRKNRELQLVQNTLYTMHLKSKLYWFYKRIKEFSSYYSKYKNFVVFYEKNTKHTYMLISLYQIFSMCLDKYP